MIKIDGHNLYRDGEKIGWIDGKHIRNEDDMKRGYFDDETVYDEDGHKLAYIRGNRLCLEDGGEELDLDKLNDKISGSEPPVVKCAIHVLLGN